MSKKGHKGKAVKAEEPKGLDPLDYARKVCFVIAGFFWYLLADIHCCDDVVES
jgi:hypothetical protein